MSTGVEPGPLAGSPSGIADIASTAARGAAALSATRADLVRLDRALQRHRSRAVDAARDAVVRLVARTDLSQEVLRAVAAALSDRATALAGEQQDAQRALQLRADARGRLHEAEADEAAAWREAALHPELTDGVHRVWEARTRAAQARADVAAAEADWCRARDAHESGSRRTAARLGGLDRVEALRLAAAHGLHVPQFGTSWQRGVELAVRLQAVRPDAGRSDRERARADLEAAIREAGDDPALWTAFWEHATPAQLYRAFGVDAADPATVAALRDGLDSWAGAATPAEQRAMGRTLVDDLGHSLLGLRVRSDLLGRLLAADLPAALYTGAADAVVDRRAPGGYDAVDLDAVGPAVVGIAAGLSDHPDAALDHLAGPDTDVAQQRAHVWFGMAPPDGWPDGGEAVTGLLAAAVTAGASSPTDTDQRRAAVLVTRATPELAGTHGLLSGRVPVSDEASRRTALAYEPYIPYFEETLKEFTAQVRPQGTTARPVLDSHDLAQVIGTTSRTPWAAEHWLLATDRYVERVADEIRTMPTTDRAPRNELARATLGDAGFVGGATGSSVIFEARSREEREAAAAAVLSTGLGVATLPAGPVAGAAAAGTGVLLPQLLPDHVTGARELVLHAEPVLRDRFVAPLELAAQDADVAAGYSAEKALERSTSLDDNSGDSTGRFGQSFNDSADLRRENGEIT
ncbi:hypothetical protein [Isoptericola aurantiacus]|uniref:hypothetical protein n=1 Tax=Isoptericola aurantiacus TaxID=3377839 RepID=UPI00383AE3C7